MLWGGFTTAAAHPYAMLRSGSITLPSRRTLGLVLLGGTLHLVIAGALWLWFGFSTRVNLFLVWAVVGAASLGAIPALLLATGRLVTPSLVVAGGLAASAYGTWSVYVAPPVTPTPVDPTPFGWYLVGWVLVAALALLVGGAEYGLRRHWSEDGSGSSRVLR